MDNEVMDRQSPTSSNKVEIEKAKWLNILRDVLEEDITVSEIEANSFDSIFIKKKGQRINMTDSPHFSYKDKDDYLASIIGLISLIDGYDFKAGQEKGFKFLVEGRVMTSAGPNARSCRVHIVMPPVSDSPQLTIACKSPQFATLNDLQRVNSFTGQAKNFINCMIDCDQTIVLSGGTGAGKALHEDTLIPTPTGISRVADLNVGDFIFSDNGQPTQITAKYCPMDEVCYELTFSNGESIKTSGGHLWEIQVDDSQRDTIAESTNIDRLLQEGHKVTLKHLSAPVYYTNNENGGLTQLLKDYANGGVNDIDYHFIETTVKEREYFLQQLHQLTGSKENKSTKQITLSGNNDLLAYMAVLTAGSLGLAPALKQEGYEFTITYAKSIDDVVITVDKADLISDNMSKYFCFKVSAPSELFLCGFSFIVTHNTTMLEAMTKSYKPDTRIGVVEDSPELALSQKNVTYLHSTLWAPGTDPNAVAPLSWCVQQLNRQRVDKIIIGETRGKEFYDFIIASNSGCEGSLTTIHANDPKNCLEKMAEFYQSGSDGADLRSANRRISKTVSIVIQLGHNEKGQNRMKEIIALTEILGEDSNATIATEQIAHYDEDEDKIIFDGNLPDKVRELVVSKGYDPNTYRKVGNEDEDTSGPELSRRRFGMLRR